MTLEILKEYTIWLFGWFVVVISITWILNLFPTGRDDTDEQGWFGKRSGVTPVTDNRTGCQYLVTSNGGITPRLDVYGKHIGCK